jgi:molybdenum-dependent DNA-binding transcriptional regulator ModE
MNEIKQFYSIKDASKELNICYSNIKAVLCNKQNKAGGFLWKYLDLIDDFKK